VAVIGKLMGRAYYAVDRRRRKIIKANLSLVFGEELNNKQRENLAKRSCEYFAMNMMDAVKLNKIVTSQNYHKYIEITGHPTLRESIKSGKGIIGLTGHFGNFLLLRYLCYLDIPPRGAIARKLDNPYLERFFSSIIKKHDVIIIRPKGAIKKMEQLLNQKAVALTLADHKAGRNRKGSRHGVVVDFFGIPSQTHITAPLLARRTGAAIIPVFVVRKGPGRYRIEINRSLDVISTADEKGDLERAARKINKIFEDYIKKYPQEWFWFHRRWKKVPGLEDLYDTDNPLEVINKIKATKSLN
jgi:KDO2-lipid IV(A) lauroyltransferase